MQFMGKVLRKSGCKMIIRLILNDQGAPPYFCEQSVLAEVCPVIQVSRDHHSDGLAYS